MMFQQTNQKKKAEVKFESCQGKAPVQKTSGVSADDESKMMDVSKSDAEDGSDAVNEVGDNTACPDNKVVLEKETFTSVTKTCGAADNIKCSGCAQLSGSNCAKCTGGYILESG